MVHGHSSHHPRPVEIYRGKLILYGCGDCIDDYEGVSGYEDYRDDLRLLYFASLLPGTGELAALRMVPTQARKMQLHHAGSADSQRLAMTLDRISRPVWVTDRPRTRRHPHPGLLTAPTTSTRPSQVSRAYSNRPL